jgi:inosose dehydratase
MLFDRRRFMLASVAGLMVGDEVLAQQAPAAAITFGFSLYGMRSLTLDDALEQCAKIGYGAVELAVLPGWPAEPQRLSRDDRLRLRRRLQDLGLELPALMENTPLHVDDKTHRLQLDRLRAAAELGRDLSPKTPPLIETILGGQPGQWDKLRKLFADRLGEWAKLAEKAQTVIAIKPHRAGAMNTPQQTLDLLRQVKSPWIQAVYDYSHFQHRDMSLADTLKAMLPATRFVHVKDTRVTKERVEFLLPGDGSTDYPALLKQLQATGYRGCVCVEVSGMIHGQKGYDPVATARRCYQNLAPAFRKAGIRLRGS